MSSYYQDDIPEEALTRYLDDDDFAVPKRKATTTSSLYGFDDDEPPSRRRSSFDAIDAYHEEKEEQEAPAQFRAPTAPSKRRPASSKTSSSGRYSLEIEGEEEDDGFDPVLDMAAGRSSASANFRQETTDDKEIDAHPLLTTHEFKVAIQRIGAGRPLVPDYIQTAALTLLVASSVDGGNAIRLSEAARTALFPLTGQLDQMASIDPPVVLSCSIPVGSIGYRAFLEEVCTFSQYILLRVLKARFKVRLAEKVGTSWIPFDDPELNLRVRPFTQDDEDANLDTDEGARGQPFPVRECLAQAVEQLDAKQRDRLVQVEAHMLSLGKRSPRDVCDMQFIEDQLQAFKDLLSGELVVCVPRAERSRKRQKAAEGGAFE